MKKIIASLLLATGLTIGNAQPPLRTLSTYAIHINAIRNFYEQYGDDNNETWYATEYGFRAKFQQNGIASMADFNKKGGWIRSIKTYNESSLPIDIRRRVRQQYYDYHIFLVKEINQGSATIYEVSIEDSRSWMVLLVAEDNMEPIGVYDK